MLVLVVFVFIAFGGSLVFCRRCRYSVPYFGGDLHGADVNRGNRPRQTLGRLHPLMRVNIHIARFLNAVSIAAL